MYQIVVINKADFIIFIILFSNIVMISLSLSCGNIKDLTQRLEISKIFHKIDYTITLNSYRSLLADENYFY
ncbi:hypothetical protein HS5_14720 [Acidianus sp. HS-5]|nr:hypothetical protein HS5_14720 [Acidianus sp. HS-5]